MNRSPLLNSAAEALRNAKRITVLSGAGLSAASGIPTYRGVDGVWNNPELVKFSHVSGFENDTRGCQKFWAAKQALFRTSKPNAAHEALVQLQKLKPTALLTQNVDGLLQKAGATDVVELHGNIQRYRCHKCQANLPIRLLGRCWRCGGPARPDVVMFGENLDEGTFVHARTVSTSCDVFVVVGTTAAVDPVAQLPLKALNFGAKLLVINAEPILLSDLATFNLMGPAEIILPDLIKRLQLDAGTQPFVGGLGLTRLP